MGGRMRAEDDAFDTRNEVVAVENEQSAYISYLDNSADVIN